MNIVFRLVTFAGTLHGREGWQEIDRRVVGDLTEQELGEAYGPGEYAIIDEVNFPRPVTIEVITTYRVVE